MATGKTHRLCLIIVPYLLALASFVCLIATGLVCEDNGGHAVKSLYFIRFAWSIPQNKAANSSSAGSPALNHTLEAYGKAPSVMLYSLGLWGYSEEILDTSYFPTNFSSHSAGLWSNHFASGMLDMNTSGTGIHTLRRTLKIYEETSIWMRIAYLSALATTATELLVGLCTIQTRWGTYIAVLVSVVSLFFAAVTAIFTLCISSLFRESFTTVLSDHGITSNMGSRIYVLIWTALACSFCACMFWGFSALGFSRHVEGSGKHTDGDAASYYVFGPHLTDESLQIYAMQDKDLNRWNIYGSLRQF